MSFTGGRQEWQDDLSALATRTPWDRAAADLDEARRHFMYALASLDQAGARRAHQLLGEQVVGLDDLRALVAEQGGTDA